MTDLKELERAYATLGVDPDASLAEARAAYEAWSALLGDDLFDAAGADPEGPGLPGQRSADQPAGGDAEAALLTTALARHELDLAWHAISEAHASGVLFLRQARGCEQCGATPAVRVTFTATRPGVIRARVESTPALTCRDCGLLLYRQIQSTTLRRGWWGVTAPVRNARAVTRNATEARFLRRIDPPTHRNPRAAAAAERLAAADPGPAPGRLARGRVTAWLTAFGAAALIVGLAVPASAPAPEPPAGPAEAPTAP